MLVMKDKIQHNNIVRFYGLTDLDNDKYVISEYCSKGQLTDLIQNDKFNLTNELKLSLAIDIAQGMAYLHSKNMIHGSLKSSGCLIDSKWTVNRSRWSTHILHSDNLGCSPKI
jgi:serine/threonine protein kinase